MGRSRLRVLLAALAWLAGLATLAAWALQAPPGRGHALVACVLLLCGLLAWVDLRREPTGLLRWDGADWTWTRAGRTQAVRVEPAWDLQRVLLARLVPVGSRHGAVSWLWLQCDDDPTRWRALRRAVYFSCGSAALPA